MTTEATPGALGSNDQLGPVAWALTAFGCVQKIVMRADVADELACKWRESDPEATAVPLYSWATVEAERSRYAPVMQAVEWLLDEGHMKLPALPEPMFNERGPRAYGATFSASQMRAYATAAVLAERERQQSLHMRRLTGLWRFGREVLPVANISFEAFLFQLDGFIDEKTMAHPLTPPAVKEG